MNKDDIEQGMAEIFYFNCEKCGQTNLSRDEVHQIKRNVEYHRVGKIVQLNKGKYICLKCSYKDEGG